MKFMLSLIALTLSLPAFANDGGIVGVKVENLKLETVDRVDDTTKRAPLELKQGQSVEMTFDGDLSELMKYLPGVRSVFKDHNKHVRSLAIAAKEGYMTITCEDADLDYSKEKPVYTPKKPTCTVSMNKYEKPVEDEYVTDLFGDFEALTVPRSCERK